MSGRCKSCNNKLRDSEIIWNPVLKQHEELCGVCRASLYEDEEEDSIAGGLIYTEDLDGDRGC